MREALAAAVSRAWLAVGLLAATLVVVELAASVVERAIDTLGQRSSVDTRYLADAYAGSDWAREYYEEFERGSRFTWSSYVYWRHAPWASRYINVDASGVRATWMPPSGPEHAAEVWMFGGSTLWGTGARDDGTIPSLLARELSERHGVPALIVNFGETGYVSTQEAIALALELRGPRPRPHLVIFYDGLNDTFSSLQNGVAGLPQNEENRRREFNLVHPGRRADLLGEAFGPNAIRGTATFRLVSAILQRIAPASATPAPLPDLVRATVDAYKANVRAVEQLGHLYGFETLFFWQPVVFDKDPLTAYERARADDLRFAEAMIRSVGDAVATDSELRGGGRFRDLRATFRGHGTPVFVDAAHLAEAGNREIAAAMTPVVLEALGRLAR